MTEKCTKDVKFHKIQNSNLEWIEYPSEMFYQKDITNKNNIMLVVSNILNNQPQLVQELKELYGPEVAGIMERWIRIEVERDENGHILSTKNIVHNCTSPIIREGFTHSLVFVSEDKNYLEFIKWDIQKKLEERQKLSNLDVPLNNVEVPEISDTLQQDKQAPEVVIEKHYTSLNELFKDMNKAINDFFKLF